MSRQEDGYGVSSMPDLVRKPLSSNPAEWGRYQVEIQGSPLEIVFLQGDITDLPVQTDAIMCPSNIFLQQGIGLVAKRFNEVAGNTPFQEAASIAEKAVKGGQIDSFYGFQDAQSFAVSPGRLAQKGVKHMVFSALDNNWGITTEQIGKAVANTIQAASERGDTSLAVPLMGTGSFHVRPLTTLESVTGILKGVQRYKETLSAQHSQNALKTLYIVSYTPQEDLTNLSK